MRVNYAIVFVSDMDRSVAFYRDVVGLELKFESPDWTEFATDGATLALHKSHEPTDRAGGQDGMPAGRCRPGLQVPDLDEFHRRMLTHAVSCIQNPTEVFGSRVAQYRDPDGLVISVGEARTG
ncbi:MAG: VOC family protein [Gemmatimonadales bacterium]